MENKDGKMMLTVFIFIFALIISISITVNTMDEKRVTDLKKLDSEFMVVIDNLQDIIQERNNEIYQLNAKINDLGFLYDRCKNNKEEWTLSVLKFLEGLKKEVKKENWCNLGEYILSRLHQVEKLLSIH